VVPVTSGVEPMRPEDLVQAAQPDAVVERLAEQRPELTQHGHGHDPSMESVREATYRGHHITIRTTYRIEVDGRPILGHMGVTNDGQVHYHPIPNLGFASAVDLIKQLIDTFPEDFETAAALGEPDLEHEHEHAHGHDDTRGS
jgi:hypothetical protein